MASKLNLKIVTPDRVVFDGEVDNVVATALDGEMAILPGHQPLLTALKIDVLRFHDGREESHAAVMGGVMEVARNEVTVLSDHAELDIEIDEAEAMAEKERREAEKIQKVDKLDVYLAEMALSKSMARLKAAELGRLKKRTRV
jgi:F-type H+-transporting ATPase subunit epsilon